MYKRMLVANELNMCSVKMKPVTLFYYSSLQIIKYVYLYFKGTLVMTLKASDGDEGDPRNITYSLVTSMYANLAHHRFIFSLLFFVNVAKFYKIT